MKQTIVMEVMYLKDEIIVDKLNIGSRQLFNV